MNLIDTLYLLIDEHGPQIAREAASGNTGTYYNTSYFIDGLLSAAEGTGNRRLMSLVVSYIDDMVSREWGPRDERGWLDQLGSFQGASPIARAAAILMGSDWRVKYAEKANQYITFCHNTIIKPWFDKVSGVYADPTSTRLAGKIPWLTEALGGWGEYAIWNDKCSHLGCIAASLYKATKSPLYYEIASRIATDFRSRLVKNGTGWIWDSGIPADVWIKGYYRENTPVCQHDTSHANREPRMVTLMHEASIVFTQADVVRMAGTLTDTIWNQSAENPQFTNYINGDNSAFGSGIEPSSRGNVYFGWAFLAGHSVKAYRAMRATFDAMMDGKAIGQNSTPEGCIALCSHLLRAENYYQKNA